MSESSATPKISSPAPISNAARIKELLVPFSGSDETTPPCDLAWQKDFYEDLHRNPELSHEEERTAQKILEELQRIQETHGITYEIQTGIGGHGIVAVHNNPGSSGTSDSASGTGPTVLMRADFDALPVKEESGASYASTNGCMHACGHDMHATALLGACEILASTTNEWSGTFIALFQPAEETSVGAKYMLADNLTERIPKPDVCLGQHIMPGKAGVVSSKPGAILAGCDSLRITVFGSSAHASMPHKAIDPTYIAAMIIIRLQAIVGREVSPEDFFVISVGELHAGDKNNIIPASAEIVLNTRFYKPELAEKVYDSVRAVVHAECMASGSPKEPTFEFFAHGEVVDNDPTVFESVREVFDEVFASESIDAERSTASEDFCYIPQAFGVPYLFWFVGSTPDELMDNPPVNHQSNFLPAYGPTVTSSTRAAAAAILNFLAN